MSTARDIDLSPPAACGHAADMVNRLLMQYGELIEDQCGVLARWQLADRPGDQAAADLLSYRGRWQALYRGVYATFPGTPKRTSLLWAAVCRCGPEAVLSHATAAELDEVCEDSGPAIHVTIPRHQRVRLSASEFGGAAAHRRAPLVQAGCRQAPGADTAEDADSRDSPRSCRSIGDVRRRLRVDERGLLEPAGHP